MLDLAAGKVTHVHCPPPRLPVGAAAGQQEEPVPQPPVQSAADFAAEAQQRILDAAMGFSCWCVPALVNVVPACSPWGHMLAVSH